MKVYLIYSTSYDYDPPEYYWSYCYLSEEAAENKCYELNINFGGLLFKIKEIEVKE